MKKLYVILFSGGRTSAFLAKYMKEHPHYKNCIFIFMNTGKEREETLIFADKCDKEFGLNLVYIEALVNNEKANGKIPKGFELHHIDLNKLNNEISNLQLVTPKEHTEIHSRLRNGSGMNKKVKCIETGEIFDSIVQVGKKHNQHASNVSRYYIDAKRKLDGYTYEKIN